MGRIEEIEAYLKLRKGQTLEPEITGYVNYLLSRVKKLEDGIKRVQEILDVPAGYKIESPQIWDILKEAMKE